MLPAKSPPEELQKRNCRGVFNQCVYCPVSPPAGTARPGQMSDCFFDLLAPAMRVRAWATKPGAETKLMAEEIIKSITRRNICDAFDYACADLEASSLPGINGIYGSI